MSWKGDLLKAGISSDGIDVDIFGGNISARNLWVPVGNVYYVDKRVSSSGTGRSWSQAYKTIAEAITVMNARISWSDSPWAKNDICFIGPGTYAENITSLPYGCTLIGAGHDNRDAQLGTKIKPATGVPIDVGAAINSAFIDIGFEALASVIAFDAAILNNCLFERCFFSGPAETATAVGVETKDCVRTVWRDCYFTCLDKGIDVNYADGGDSFSHCLIDGCNFLQIDTAGIEISTNLVGPSTLITKSNFLGAGATMAYAVHDSSAIVDVTWCAAESTNGYSGVRSVNGSYNNGALVT